MSIPRWQKKILLSAMLIAFAGGCATEPGETTAMGAAAGGVIGAGLGAVVGSQTGDPGTGFVLGAAAGTAAGAAIGNEIQAQDEEIDEQEEKLARHEKTLAAQRGEIAEIRRSQSDVASQRPLQQQTNAFNRNSYSSARGRGFPNQGVPSQQMQYQQRSPATPPFQGSSMAQRQADTRARLAPVPMKSQGSELVPRDAMTDDSNIAARMPGENTGKGAMSERTLSNPAAVQQAPAVQKPSDIFAPTNSKPLWQPPAEDVEEASQHSALKPVPVAIGDEPDMDADVVALNAASEEKVAPTVKDHSKRETAKESAARETKEAPPGNECAQAESEMSKAQAVTETADKLFHFRRALRLCPSNPSYHTNLGDLYLSLKRKSDAEFEFNEALKIDPSYRPAKDKLSAMKGA